MHNETPPPLDSNQAETKKSSFSSFDPTFLEFIAEIFKGIFGLITFNND